MERWFTGRISKTKMTRHIDVLYIRCIDVSWILKNGDHRPGLMSVTVSVGVGLRVGFPGTI